jgi:hypothetical protein
VREIPSPGYVPASVNSRTVSVLLSSRMLSIEDMPDPFYANDVFNYRRLEPHELTYGDRVYRSGNEYTTFMVDPAVYMAWLTARATARGVKFVQRYVA